jgi:N-acetylglucosamine-6-phosphate deacetylase
LEKGRISSVLRPGESLPASDLNIDAEGRILMPGFIDIHSHGADGHDVCDDSLEAIRHIARRKLQEGVTTWLPTTLTLPQAKLESIAGKCAAYRVHEEFCRTPGLHVEGPFINRKYAGAQNPEFVRPPDFEELKRLHGICPVVIVSLAPEMEGADEVIRRAAAIGITSSAAHTAANAECIRDAKRAGLTHLTHFCNAMAPLHHREIGGVGVGLVDDSLKLELICDAIHLSPDMLKLVFQLVSMDRLILITDSMAASWIGEGEVMLGGLAVQVKDGKAVLKEGGALAGSALLYNQGVRNVLEMTGLPLDQVVKATSWNQAQSLGLSGFGKIEPGYHADLVLLDADFSVWRTFVGGQAR